MIRGSAVVTAKAGLATGFRDLEWFGEFCASPVGLILIESIKIKKGKALVF